MVYGNGFRSIPSQNMAAPPYSRGGYSFSEDLRIDGHLRREPGRVYFEEFFKQKPGLNAAVANTTANQDFEVLGTSMISGLATFSATSAGLVLTTASADNDQCILTPHLDTDQTGWASVLWGTENQVKFEAQITVGDDITTGLLLWCGLKLTNDPTVATDDDQVFVRFSTDDSDTNWEVVSSIAGTDTTADSGVAVAVSTQYNIQIHIDSARLATVYINETLVATTTALTNDVDLIPYIGIQALSAAAEFVTVNYVKISRMLFE